MAYMFARVMLGHQRKWKSTAALADLIGAHLERTAPTRSGQKCLTKSSEVHTSAIYVRWRDSAIELFFQLRNFSDDQGLCAESFRQPQIVAQMI